MKKTSIKVLDNGALQGVCSCSWKGNAFVQKSGLTSAITAAGNEIAEHKCLPQPKKPRKKREKK